MRAAVRRGSKEGRQRPNTRVGAERAKLPCPPGNLPMTTEGEVFKNDWKTIFEPAGVQSP